MQIRKGTRPIATSRSTFSVGLHSAGPGMQRQFCLLQLLAFLEPFRQRMDFEWLSVLSDVLNFFCLFENDVRFWCLCLSFHQWLISILAACFSVFYDCLLKENIGNTVSCSYSIDMRGAQLHPVHPIFGFSTHVGGGLCQLQFSEAVDRFTL